MTGNTSYADIIETAIQAEIDVIGKQVALRQARKVPDLRLNDDGTVEEITGPGEVVLREVVKTYRDITGPVATAIIENAVREAHGDAVIDNHQPIFD